VRRPSRLRGAHATVAPIAARDKTPRLVFLYGPPAVGKLTVARAVAARNGFRVLHNHITIDPVAEVLEFGTPVFFDVVGRFRRDLVEAAAREGVDLVYTFVFAAGDEPYVDQIVDAFEAAGGSVTFVQLTAPRDELLRRVVEPGRRTHGKISDVETLQKLLSEHDVFAAVPGRESVTIDVGSLSADQAAQQIVDLLES
jgi:shikimate kinase